MLSKSYSQDTNTLAEEAGFSTPTTQKTGRKALQLQPQCNEREIELENPTPIKLGWLAGFIDGEGTFEITRRIRENGVPYYYPRIRVTNTNLYVLRCIEHQFGGSVTTNGKPKPGHKLGYRWNLGGVRAGKLANSLVNLLVVKHDTAELFIRFCDYYRRPSASLITLQEYKRKLHKVNRRGV